MISERASLDIQVFNLSTLQINEVIGLAEQFESISCVIHAEALGVFEMDDNDVLAEQKCE